MTGSDVIYDPLRRKWVARTPEEEVRQAVIAWLRDVQGFPTGLMESEYGFVYNRRRYRADILAFDRQLRPHLLVECKAPGVKLDAEVIDQVVRYTRVLKVNYVMVTNGTVTHLLRRKDGEDGYAVLDVLPESLLPEVSG
jgi:hypothetical protein